MENKTKKNQTKSGPELCTSIQKESYERRGYTMEKSKSVVGNVVETDEKRRQNRHRTANNAPPLDMIRYIKL